MEFFNKYKLHIHVVFLFFWIYILYGSYVNENFKSIKLVLPILFIILSIFNIYKAIQEKNLKSRN